MKTFSFGDILTEQQAKLARETFRKYGKDDQSEPFSVWARREIITPETMLRIDALTGQENDPMYMAYALEYVLMRAEAR